ncbi:MAG: glutaredoxin family protein [Marinomonas sp.]|uniref:glutaredoxin family protein n=1 Tax=unclassified Marinomonas TaxID=196814 RepID=UPI000698B237|nr:MULTISPECIES: glutaredoxin domain-containing protein [unclassified Marinomonas]
MSKSNTVPGLALYHYHACPFCAYTRQALDKLKLNVERRDIQKSAQHRGDLIAGGGSKQVPCLRIEREDGQVKWLYESQDIVKFLVHYSQQTDLIA